MTLQSVGATILLGLTLFAGCNYTKPKESTTDQNAMYELPDEKKSELSFGLLARNVFSQRCTSCHGTSGGVNLQSYSEVIRNLSKIEKSVFVEKTMPKNSALTREQLAYLWNWIKIGAPELPSSGSAPPLEEPIQATFDSINKHILQVSCKDCHNPGGSGKRIPLDKDSLLNSPLELVLPGNPDESGLVIAVERLDDKSMPPKKNGYSPLSDEEKQTIRSWIQKGAVD